MSSPPSILYNLVYPLGQRLAAEDLTKAAGPVYGHPSSRRDSLLASHETLTNLSPDLIAYSLPLWQGCPPVWRLAFV